jgi:hypothetical protein
VVERTGYRAEILGGDGTTAPWDGSVAIDRTGAPAGRPTATGAPEEEGGGSFDYDLLVVGTGGAGTAAAIRGSELGARVAIMEGADVVGGTCVNIGCIPSKNLIEAAHHYHTARTAFPGIQPCEPQIAWKEVLRQKQEIMETLRQEKYLDVLACGQLSVRFTKLPDDLLGCVSLPLHLESPFCPSPGRFRLP